MKILNKIFPHFTGIDIGSASIKIVEIARIGKRTTLKNYAYLESATYGGEPFRSFKEETLSLATERAVEAIKSCFETAEISPQKVIFSLPDFSSFFISFDLPLMGGDELTKAINFHASKYIPIPMDEIVLDWQQIEPVSKEEKKSNLHILAIAIPKITMNQYRAVADAVGISNFILEPEAFSLFRLFRPKDDSALCVIDFGAKSTTLSFGDKNGLQNSHSLDVASEKIVSIFQNKAGLSPEEALALFKESGFTDSQPMVKETLIEAMRPLINAFNESWQIIQKRGMMPGRRPNIVLVGGLAWLPGLTEYLKDALNADVQVGDPLVEIEYPSLLEPVVREIGPTLGVAAGASLRSF